MNLCELFLVILLVLIDGCFLLDTYLVIIHCVICVYVLALTKIPWMFGWVLGLRFVHFDTVFENFSLCTSCGSINSFLTSFDGVLPILLLGVDESEVVWGRRGVLEEERGERCWDWWGGESVVLGMCRFRFWGWRWLLPWVFGKWEIVGIVCFLRKLRKLEEVFDFLL